MIQKKMKKKLQNLTLHRLSPKRPLTETVSGTNKPLRTNKRVGRLRNKIRYWREWSHRMPQSVYICFRTL